MEILVTGGMGYIGSHTCVQLMNAGMTPVIVDNLCNANAKVLARITAITGKEPVFYQGISVMKPFLTAYLPNTVSMR